MTMYPTKVAPTGVSLEEAVTEAVNAAQRQSQVFILDDTYMRVEETFNEILKRLPEWDIEFISRKQHWIAMANGGRIYVENMAVPQGYRPDLTLRVRR
jgi:hypothetical protein